MPKSPVPYGDQPAFPCDVPVEFYDSGEIRRTAAGLTVRDWLAGQALAGFCAADAEEFRSVTSGAFAKLAYEYADAMLAEREKKGGAQS